jgi:hypothetical protein
MAKTWLEQHGQAVGIYMSTTMASHVSALREQSGFDLYSNSTAIIATNAILSIAVIA